MKYEKLISTFQLGRTNKSWGQIFQMFVGVFSSSEIIIRLRIIAITLFRLHMWQLYLQAVTKGPRRERVEPSRKSKKKRKEKKTSHRRKKMKPLTQVAKICALPLLVSDLVPNLLFFICQTIPSKKKNLQTK